MCPVYGESNRNVKMLQARRKVSTQSYNGGHLNNPTGEEEDKLSLAEV